MKHRILLYLVLVATLCMGCGGRIGMRQLERLEAQLDNVSHLVQQGLVRGCRHCICHYFYPPFVASISYFCEK